MFDTLPRLASDGLVSALQFYSTKFSLCLVGAFWSSLFCSFLGCSMCFCCVRHDAALSTFFIHHFYCVLFLTFFDSPFRFARIPPYHRCRLPLNLPCPRTFSPSSCCRIHIIFPSPVPTTTLSVPCLPTTHHRLSSLSPSLELKLQLYRFVSFRLASSFGLRSRRTCRRLGVRVMLPPPHTLSITRILSAPVFITIYDNVAYDYIQSRKIHYRHKVP